MKKETKIKIVEKFIIGYEIFLMILVILFANLGFQSGLRGFLGGNYEHLQQFFVYNILAFGLLWALNFLPKFDSK